MKKLLFLVIISILLNACSTKTGHLTGVLNRPTYQPEIPLGMVYVKGGAFNMGDDDQDVPFLHNSRKKTASVQAFYMDQTEITNNEYRQFCEHVRDSTALELIYINNAISMKIQKKWWITKQVIVLKIENCFH